MHGETAKKKERAILSEAARYVFQQLKKVVMSILVLAYSDPSKEYLLETDALELGLGAVLSQKQSDGRYHPIAFGSRALHGVQVNFHSTKLEFLAMKWLIEHFQTYLLGHHFKVHMDSNPLTYFLMSPNMDATKQRWINELAKYDFPLKYQKGKNNTVANTLSQIREERLPNAEAEELLETVPIIPGGNTIIRVFEEKEEDKPPEKRAPHTMSSAAMKAVFNNLTSGAGRRAEQEYNTGSAAHLEADAIEINVRSTRVSTQMHVMDWVEAQQEDPEIEAAMDWCYLDKKKSEPWIRQRTKLEVQTWIPQEHSGRKKLTKECR